MLMAPDSMLADVRKVLCLQQMNKSASIPAEFPVCSAGETHLGTCQTKNLDLLSKQELDALPCQKQCSRPVATEHTTGMVLQVLGENALFKKKGLQTDVRNAVSCLR